jgi:TPM domain
MRIVGLFGAVLTILTAGLLLETSAGAQPPAKLTDHITDSSGVLTDSSRATVRSAIDRLYRDRHVQLWVVDNFSRFKPDNWADRARSESGMGDNDALLAVATNTKLYAFTVPPKAQGLEQPTNRPNHYGYGRAPQRRRAGMPAYIDQPPNGPTEAINGRLGALRGDPYCTAATSSS